MNNMYNIIEKKRKEKWKWEKGDDILSFFFLFSSQKSKIGIDTFFFMFARFSPKNGFPILIFFISLWRTNLFVMVDDNVYVRILEFAF